MSTHNVAYYNIVIYFTFIFDKILLVKECITLSSDTLLKSDLKTLKNLTHILKYVHS